MHPPGQRGSDDIAAPTIEGAAEGARRAGAQVTPTGKDLPGRNLIGGRQNCPSERSLAGVASS